VAPDQQDHDFTDQVSEVEHGARPPKHEITKRPRIGPMWSQHLITWEAGPERGANAHRIAGISCCQGKDRGHPF
jgi:hypothetical protein